MRLTYLYDTAPERDAVIARAMGEGMPDQNIDTAALFAIVDASNEPAGLIRYHWVADQPVPTMNMWFGLWRGSGTATLAGDMHKAPELLGARRLITYAERVRSLRLLRRLGWREDPDQPATYVTDLPTDWSRYHGVRAQHHRRRGLDLQPAGAAAAACAAGR